MSIACHAEPASPPASRPEVEGAEVTGTEVVPVASIASLEDLAQAASQGFEGRIDVERGVVFADIYDDEGEEPKPITAVRLCGPQLLEWSEVWARDLHAFLEDPEGLLQAFPDYARCEDERCWHEAAMAGMHRGLYRFEAGVLREVAWTSGPPGHVMTSFLEAEDRFIAEAFAALRDAPCGASYEGTLEG